MKFTFPAVKGVQGKRSVYDVMLPFHSLGQIVTINPEVQRKMSMKRARQIYEYICNNQTDFYFPNITLAAPGHLDWNDKSRTLSWEDTSKLSAVDGQHRVKGILMLMESPLGELFAQHHIGATIYPHMQVNKQADMFSIVNGEQKPVTKAVRELRNFHNRANRVTRDVIAHLNISDKVEWWTSSLKDKSDRWFAFTWMLEANRWLLQSLGGTDELNAVRLIAEFWNTVLQLLEEYLGKPQEYIVSSSPIFMLIGQVGKRIITDEDCNQRLLGLASLNWARPNSSFEGTLLINGSWRRGAASAHGVSLEAQRVLMRALRLDSPDSAS